MVVGLMVFLFGYTHCGLEVEHERRMSDHVSKRKRGCQLSQKVRFSSHGEIKLKSWVRETGKREVSLETLTDCFLIK